MNILISRAPLAGAWSSKDGSRRARQDRDRFFGDTFAACLQASVTVPQRLAVTAMSAASARSVGVCSAIASIEHTAAQAPHAVQSIGDNMGWFSDSFIAPTGQAEEQREQVDAACR
ncbi:hypothetical protein MFP24_11745 [Brenneria sp. WC1b.1]|nr:hypothetical protein [Brenneria tiliae]MCL2898005.1 hypothetical protein [Brenneria tiliae]MCL2902086.1 hypothetical protein [Brenneria tiliae]